MFVIWDFRLHRLPKSYRKEALIYERLRKFWDKCPVCKRKGLTADIGESFCIEHGTYFWYSHPRNPHVTGVKYAPVRPYNGPERA